MQLSGSGLACVRSGRVVFRNVDFSVGSGESLQILGPNGAGKSSLLRMIAGLVRVAAGKLSLSGGDAELSLAEQVHYLGHQDALKPALSVSENLSFWTRYFGDLADQSCLAAVGLSRLADIPGGLLSAGQRRRLSLARLLAVKRPIWLLDEPTSSLDAAAQELLGGLMREHLAAGGLICAATHGPLGLDPARELRLV